jgi:hypothetical protein
LTVAETPVYNKRNTFEALCLLSRLKSAREFKLMASECTRFEFDSKKRERENKKKNLRSIRRGLNLYLTLKKDSPPNGIDDKMENPA